ncbi:MAG: spermidine/putrescine ABC transporter substrate-binding protein [Treponema sp.]|jgi:spermidine/putrescine-binding protein|nr:spermidine/putrescine ABC transporter substrate-binding protein [Treponema sp.]
MKRIWLLLVSLAIISAGCAREAGKNQQTQAPQNRQFTLFTWDGMFPQEILDGFERDSGYRINYVNFDYDETMLSRLETAGGGDYDLIIADDYIIETAIAEGLVRKLDKSKIPNYKNVNPVYLKPFYDPSDEYTLPYGAGVQTIVYDPSQININITGYADLWDSSLRGRVGTIANYRVINGMALKVLGKSYNTENLDDIRAAGQRLLGLAANIRLIKDDDLQSDLLSGEIAAGVMYTSQVTSAKMENPGLEVVFPSEGIGYGIMGAFIPSKAPNADAAYAFMDSILDPQRGAECFEYLGYYCTFSASEPLISGDYKEFLTLPGGFNVDMEMIGNIGGEAEEEHARVWTAFREATGLSE